MHFDERVEAVGLPGQQRLQFATRDLGLELLQGGFRLGDNTRVFLGVAELDHADIVLNLAFDAAERTKRILKRGALLHQPAGALRVVPKIGVFGEVVQFGKAGARFVEVKDASSAAQGTA